MYIVFTTVSNQEAGENLAEKIVSNKLAACVQIIPKMTSVYLWEGELKKETEHLLLIKTLDSAYKELKDFIEIARNTNKKYPKPQKIIIKKGKRTTKFKLRLSNYLLTFKVDEEQKAKKITQSIPPELQKIEINCKK